MRLLLTVALAVVGVTSCTTYESRPVVLNQVAEAGVSTPTVKRLEQGRVLSYDDILDLVRKGVPDEAIVSYLHSARAPYKFSNKELIALSDAGAGSKLVNYLGKSTGFYDATQRDQTGEHGLFSHPYFNDPNYWGPAPFDWGYPPAWFTPMDFGDQQSVVPAEG